MVDEQLPIRGVFDKTQIFGKLNVKCESLDLIVVEARDLD
jgi:hypothetical protein